MFFNLSQMKISFIKIDRRLVFRVETGKLVDDECLTLIFGEFENWKLLNYVSVEIVN
jgi:hypothetical protein